MIVPKSWLINLAIDGDCPNDDGYGDGDDGQAGGGVELDDGDGGCDVAVVVELRTVAFVVGAGVDGVVAALAAGDDGAGGFDLAEMLGL